MTSDDGTFVEAGRIVAAKETPRLRAIRLLNELVPKFASRDKAIEHLYYRTPSANPEVRLYSIAAALYILGTDDQ